MGDASSKNNNDITQPSNTEKFIYASIDVESNGTFSVSSEIAFDKTNQPFRFLLSLFTPYISLAKSEPRKNITLYDGRGYDVRSSVNG